MKEELIIGTREHHAASLRMLLSHRRSAERHYGTPLEETAKEIINKLDETIDERLFELEG